jgi:hypothetical protein
MRQREREEDEDERCVRSEPSPGFYSRAVPRAQRLPGGEEALSLALHILSPTPSLYYSTPHHSASLAAQHPPTLGKPNGFLLT